MRFKVKPKRAEPSIGDVRIISRFAFLPVRIENCFVWLEFYSVFQRYSSTRKSRHFPNHTRLFEETEWVDENIFTYK